MPLARVMIRRTALASALGVLTSMVAAWVFVALSYYREPSSWIEAEGPIDPAHGCRADGASGEFWTGCVKYQSTSGMSFTRSVNLKRTGVPASDWVPDWARPDLSMTVPRPSYSNPADMFVYDWHFATAAGWPFLCLQCAPFFTATPGPDFPCGCRGGLVVPARWTRSDPRNPLILPCSPLYPALLANSALYASLWSLLLFTPGSIRRHIRRRRGRCPRCAYDLGADFAPGCPECGWNRS